MATEPKSPDAETLKGQCDDCEGSGLNDDRYAGMCRTCDGTGQALARPSPSPGEHEALIAEKAKARTGLAFECLLSASILVRWAGEMERSATAMRPLDKRVAEGNDTLALDLRQSAARLNAASDALSRTPGSMEGDWLPVSSAPAACHVLATRFDEAAGEWVVALVASPPTRPFTHWRMLPPNPDASPPASGAAGVGELDKAKRLVGTLVGRYCTNDEFDAWALLLKRLNAPPPGALKGVIDDLMSQMDWVGTGSNADGDEARREFAQRIEAALASTPQPEPEGER